MICKGRVVKATRSGSDIELVVEKADGTQTVAASHVLVAKGRRPALGGLDLDACGISANESGITVDDYQRTSNPKFFAIGEAAGRIRSRQPTGRPRSRCEARS